MRQAINAFIGVSITVALATPMAGAEDVIRRESYFVNHISTIPIINGKPVKLYVRERVRESVLQQFNDAKAQGEPAPEGKVVLALHGGSIPAETVYDPYFSDDYSMLAALADQGFDAFAMDLTTFGASTRIDFQSTGVALMENRCNLPTNGQLSIFGSICPRTYNALVRTKTSDQDEISAVIDYLLNLRNVSKVHLVGISYGGYNIGAYVQRGLYGPSLANLGRLDKVDRVVLIAPAIDTSTANPASKDLPPAVLPQVIPGTAGGPLQAEAETPGTPALANSIRGNWVNKDNLPFCPGQVADGIQSQIWAEEQMTDPLGATWGRGVIRFTLQAFWGFSLRTVPTITHPTLIVSGIQDAGLTTHNVNSNLIFNAMTGAPNRVILNLECASHLSIFESQRHTINDAIGQWFAGGNVKGVSYGSLYAFPDGYIDADAPTITIASPVNGSTVEGTIHIDASASDRSGVASFQCTPANGSDYDTLPMVNGTLTVTCTATDTRGFSGSKSVTVNVLNDSDYDGVLNAQDLCPGSTGPSIAQGCSAEQILACKPGNNKGESKHGLSPGTLEIFASSIAGSPMGWAKGCPTTGAE